MEHFAKQQTTKALQVTRLFADLPIRWKDVSRTC